MRDLQGIAEINGPRRAELQTERAKLIADATAKAVNTQIEHGKRVEERAAKDHS